MEPLPLSRSAHKKAAKVARLIELKHQRRAREKEMKKEKRRVQAEKRAAGELDDNDEVEKARKKKKLRVEFGGRVIVDLGFDHLMNEKEVVSLCSQLAYTYSTNRNASYPFSLIFTSVGGRTFDRLESLNDAGYKRWAKTEWWSEDYAHLWQTQSDAPQTESKVSKASIACAKGTVVYLTADANEELTELRADETYIIGGIVDRNRYKNLCEKKAKEANIRTARLPIQTYLADLPTRKVLTVNQVFEILVKWIETRDWEVALNHVVPGRKFCAGRKHGKFKVFIDGDKEEESTNEKRLTESREGTKDDEHFTDQSTETKSHC